MPGLKERLIARETLIGSIVSTPCLDVAELMARVGFDYLWVETEHSPMGPVDAQAVVQAIGGRCPCLMRIPDKQEVWVKKALDIGCDGIVVPHIRSAAEARQIVEWSLYPPDGQRSVGISRAHGYGITLQETIDTANDDLVIVLQAEHADAVKNIASIAQVPGIAAVLIGPYDLSGSLGVLGEIDHPRVLEAIETVRHHCQAWEVPLGIFTTDAAKARMYIEEGFSLIALSMDAFFLWQSAQAALAEARAARREGDH
jgi:2-dehydro-3-deoxyglucarate aldolase/4-hydroxy-2-oxoheptanedioate aldolase